jgi:hypothetical protein
LSPQLRAQIGIPHQAPGFVFPVCVDQDAPGQYPDRAVQYAHVLVSDEMRYPRISQQSFHETDQNHIIAAQKFHHVLTRISPLERQFANSLFSFPRQFAAISRLVGGVLVFYGRKSTGARLWALSYRLRKANGYPGQSNR